MTHVVVDDIGQYTHAEKEAALRANGRTVRFRYLLRDKAAAPIGYISSVKPGGSITYNWLSEIKREARFEMVEDGDFATIDFASNMLQPFMHLLMPDGLWAEFPLGVFVLENPGRQSDGGFVTHNIQAYDRGVQLREDLIQRKAVVKQGANIVDEVRDKLDHRNIPHDLPDSDSTLAADRTWEGGTSRAVIVNDLLDAANYASLYFDANGVARAEPYVLPGNRDAEISYETDELSVVQEQATEEVDLFNVPNRWVLTVAQPDRADLVAIFRNNDPDSPTSVQARGRVITRYDTLGEEDAANQEILNAKVRRLAHEDSSVYGHVRFQTILNPLHGENNIVHLRHDPLGLDADYSETEWAMTLAAGNVMTHTVRRKVDLNEEPSPFVAGEGTVIAPTTGKRGLLAVEFDGYPQSPLRVITQPRSSFPGSTGVGSVRGFGANHSNPQGTNLHLVHFAGNIDNRVIMYVAVGNPPDDANLATGFIRATPTANAVTSVPITFGKTLTGTVRVFFDIAGGAIHRYRRIGVSSVTSTGATLNFFRDSNKETPLHWFAIGDDGGYPYVAVGTDNITVGSPPGVGLANITYGKTLASPVRVFSVAQSTAITQGHTATSDITNTGATIRAYRETGTTVAHDWIAIGGLGSGEDEDSGDAA